MGSPALIVDGYELKDGCSSVPDAPGLGLRIDDRRFAEATKVQFDIKA